MVTRSLFTKAFLFLIVAGFCGLIALVVIVNLFGSPVYHSPADTAQARAVIHEMGVGSIGGTVGSKGVRGAPLFVPRSLDGETIAVETRLSHRAIPPGRETTVHAAVAVRADEATTDARAPLNIALVIDRSDSMSGGKLEQARAAAHAFVDALGADDRLSIASYGSEVTIVSPSLNVSVANRARLHASVDSIVSNGGTFLSGGYEAGRDLALESQQPDSINRVILFSDGLATYGLTDPAAISRIVSGGLERGVSLTTMGVGLGYDEDLMSSIATAGSGNYYFIADDRRTKEILGEELAGLQSSVARETTLTFQLADGVELVDVQGYDYRLDGNTATVDLDAFFGSQQKDLLRTQVEPKERGETTLLETALDYVDVATEQRARRSATSTVRVVSGAAEVDATILTRLQQVETAEAFSRAMRMYESGDRNGAAELLEEQAKLNDQYVRRYDIASESFDRVGAELKDLAASLRKTRRGSGYGSYYIKSGKFRSQKIMKSSVDF